MDINNINSYNKINNLSNVVNNVDLRSEVIKLLQEGYQEIDNPSLTPGEKVEAQIKLTEKFQDAFQGKNLDLDQFLASQSELLKTQLKYLDYFDQISKPMARNDVIRIQPIDDVVRIQPIDDVVRIQPIDDVVRIQPIDHDQAIRTDLKTEIDKIRKETERLDLSPAEREMFHKALQELENLAQPVKKLPRNPFGM